MNQATIDAAIKSLSTGIDPEALQTISLAYSSGDITPLAYNRILGSVFGGEPPFKGAWDQIVKGLATGDLTSQAKGLLAYKDTLSSAFTPQRALQATDAVISVLPAAYGTKVAETKDLIESLYKSDLIKRTLSGTQSPEQALLQAVRASTLVSDNPTVQAVASKIPGGIKAIKQLAAGHYMESWRSLDTLILSNLDQTQEAQKTFADMVGLGTSSADTVKSLTELLKKTDPTLSDISGMVISTVQMGQRIVNQIAQLSVQLGGSAYEAKQISTWTNIATGCVVGLATGVIGGAAVAGVGAVVGAVVGVASCAMSIVTEALDTPNYLELASKQPNAIFVPSKAQLSVTAVDADRLANALYHHFGVKTYAEIAERLYAIDPWMNPLGGAFHYPTRDSTTPTPGYTMFHVLTALDFHNCTHGTYHESAAGNVAYCLSGECLTLGNPSEHDDMYEMSLYGYDISAAQVKAQLDAYIRNLQYGKNNYLKSPQVRNDVQLADLLSVTRSHREGAQLKQLDANQQLDTDRIKRWCVSDSNPQVLNSILYAHNLLEFFTAITLQDLKTNKEGLLQYLVSDEFMSAEGLPIRLWTVGTTHRNFVADPIFQSDASDTQKADMYSPVCWTNLHRAGITECTELADRVLASSPDIGAVRELAFIRLLSAFSYMHLVYERGSTATPTATELELQNISQAATGDDTDLSVFTRPDPIKDLSVSAADPLSALARPISPLWYLKGSTLIKKDYVEIWREMQILQNADYVIKKAIAIQVAKDRRSNVVVRVADVLEVNSLITRNLLGHGSKEAIKRLTDSIGTLKGFKDKCVAAGGQFGFTVDKKGICCPSLYYNENIAKCGINNTAKCHAECIARNNYYAAVTQTLTTSKDVQNLQKYVAEAKVDPTTLPTFQVMNKSKILVAAIAKQLQTALYTRNGPLVLTLIAKYTDAQVDAGMLPTAKTVYTSKTLPADVVAAEKYILHLVMLSEVPQTVPYITALVKLRARYGIRVTTKPLSGFTGLGADVKVPVATSKGPRLMTWNEYQETVLITTPDAIQSKKNLVVGGAVVLGIGVAGTVLYNMFKK